ncbi:MAG: serine/threonine protein kinase [Armatimonadetes bacterium]|nr:serine/threonine protein kinase [Armatimonadota bacterium]
MRNLLLVVVAIIWVSRASAAQSTEVLFQTDPPGAEVYRQMASNRGNEAYLGRAGRPVELHLDQVRSSNVQLVFRLEGYHEKRETVPKYLLTSGRYPEEGEVRLEPRSWWTPLAGFLQAHPVRAGAMVLAGAVWLICWMGRRRKVHRALERAGVLEELRARADRADPHSLAVLSGYRLVERLGAGGMGTVYRAVPDACLDDSRAVAIKILNLDRSGDAAFLERFRREVRILTQLSHPGVVRLYDYGEQDGLLFLVMELMAGGTLRGAMREGGLPFAPAFRILGELMDALEYAHERGVVHRDLKPENILMSGTGKVKIVDFGLARSSEADGITQTGALVGTPSYMAPELVTEGITYLPASDQYALGVIAYELLTGRKPFEETEARRILFQQVNQPPPSLRRLRSEISEEVERVVLRMLAKIPEDRHSSLAQAASALRQASSRG